MKKSIIPFYFFLISSSFLFGQKQLGYLIKGGLNYSNITNYALDNKPILGYNLGVATEILIYDKISIQPEIQFSTQGWSLYFTDTSFLNNPGFDPAIFPITPNQNRYKIQLNYLNFPLLLKYNITNKFSFNAGPQIGFLLSTQSNSSDFKII